MQFKSPKISVIMAMFNSKKYIESCIQSILAQTFQDFEIVIVDDCSTDGSLNLIREKFSDPRIRLFRRNQNGGSGIARNDAIRASHGKYIFAMDADDMIVPNALEIFYNVAEKSNAEIVHATKSFYLLDEDAKYSPVLKIKRMGDFSPILGWQTLNLRERILREHLPARTRLPLWYNLYRRDFLIDRDILLPEIRVAEDSLFFIKTLCLSKKFLKIDAALYLYRAPNSNSLSNATHEKSFKRILIALPTIFAYFRAIFSRKDLISQISLADQLLIESVELKYIMRNYHAAGAPATMDSQLIQTLFHEITMLPEFSSPEFLSDLLKIFFYDARLNYLQAGVDLMKVEMLENSGGGGQSIHLKFQWLYQFTMFVNMSRVAFDQFSHRLFKILKL